MSCPGSVELSEGQPDKTSKWAEEGTKAHEVLETVMKEAMTLPNFNAYTEVWFKYKVPNEMLGHARSAAQFILDLYKKTPGSEVTVESKVYLDFIHPEMFGTYDGAVIDHFDTLHVFDYKYGAGHAVSPRENLQMVFYGIGLAHKHNWNFNTVRLWIIQPRIKGYDGPIFWDVPVQQLQGYVELFREAVARVEENPDTYVEGSWCHWCKAKSVCPLKNENKTKQAITIFSPKKGKSNGSKEESPGSQKSEAEWKKASSKKGRQKSKGRKKETQEKEESNFY